jgi:hypothetical protein
MAWTPKMRLIGASATTGPKMLWMAPGPIARTLRNFHGSQVTAPTTVTVGCKKAVLADAVQVVEEPQGVGGIVLPALVRLQQLDRCLCVWMPTSDLVQTTVSGRAVGLLRPLVEGGAAHPQISRPILVPEDGEFRSLRNFLRQRARVGTRQRVSEGVERGSEVVQRVTDQEADRIGAWLFDGSERGEDTTPEFRVDGLGLGTLAGYEERTPEHRTAGVRDVVKTVLVVPPSIGVEVIPDGVALTVTPRSGLALQILQVLERPVEFEVMVEHAAIMRHRSRMTQSTSAAISSQVQT